MPRVSVDCGVSVCAVAAWWVGVVGLVGGLVGRSVCWLADVLCDFAGVVCCSLLWLRACVSVCCCVWWVMCGANVCYIVSVVVVFTAVVVVGGMLCVARCGCVVRADLHVCEAVVGCACVRVVGGVCTAVCVIGCVVVRVTGVY